MEKNNETLILLDTLKSICRMEIHLPATEETIAKLKDAIPMLPDSILELYKITDGLEINVPGTIIYNAEALMRKYELMDDKQCCVLGYTNFGDEIFFNTKGEVIQIDHENGEEFLRWKSFDFYLIDEIDGWL